MFILHKYNDSSGFTLPEVLIAIVVLSIGLLGLSAMTIATMRSLSFSDNLTTATTLARKKIEQIKNASYSDVDQGDYPDETYGTIAGYKQFERQVTIADATPLLNMKTITVQVFWRNTAGDTRDVTIRNVIAK